ncbi:MAG: hypothetical protein E7314_03970 [Clostridiales bacterium]|nr:hypothetical protein [Clostridiales bacterium]
MDNIIAIIIWGAFGLFSLFMSGVGVRFASWVKNNKINQIIGMSVAILIIIWGIVLFTYSLYNIFSIL